MKGKQQAVAVLALAVLVCSAISALDDSGLGASATNGEDIEISDGSQVIRNKVIDNLLITGGSPTIRDCTIHNRVIVKAGSPIFVGNVIEDGIHADAKEGPITITNNEIHAKSGFAAIYVKGIHADITGNTINAKNTFGIEITFTISSASIRDNEFYGCNTALCTEVSSDIEIIHNLFFNNNVGIQDSSYSLIANNTITRNSFGITVSSSSIHNNNIFDNDKYNVYNWEIKDIDATNNWWGTTDAQVINQTIYDKKNETIIGTVSFEPFLDAPNPDAPVIPTDLPNEQQTTPKDVLALDWVQATVLATTVVAVAGCVAVVLRRRKTKLSVQSTFEA